MTIQLRPNIGSIYWAIDFLEDLYQPLQIVFQGYQDPESTELWIQLIAVVKLKS